VKEFKQTLCGLRQLLLRGQTARACGVPADAGHHVLPTVSKGSVLARENVMRDGSIPGVSEEKNTLFF